MKNDVATEEALAACATLVDPHAIAALAPLFETLLVVDGDDPERCLALRRGLASVVVADVVSALCDGCTSPRTIALRFVRLGRLASAMATISAVGAEPTEPTLKR